MAYYSVTTILNSCINGIATCMFCVISHAVISPFNFVFTYCFSFYVTINRCHQGTEVLIKLTEVTLTSVTVKILPGERRWYGTCKRNYVQPAVAQQQRASNTANVQNAAVARWRNT